MSIRSRHTLWKLGAAALVAAAISGCQPASAVAGVQQIDLADYRFTPNRIDAKVGVPVEIRLTNTGNEAHDLTFQSIHMPGLAGIEATLQPGETRTVSVTFDQPGTHVFICSLSEHASAGMTGAAFVQP